MLKFITVNSTYGETGLNKSDTNKRIEVVG